MPNGDIVLCSGNGITVLDMNMDIKVQLYPQNNYSEPKHTAIVDNKTFVVSIPANTGRGSSIGSESAWHASGPEFDPHVRYILSWRLGHENISTAILPLPLIQEEQLSVTGERMCTKYW